MLLRCGPKSLSSWSPKRQISHQRSSLTVWSQTQFRIDDLRLHHNSLMIVNFHLSPKSHSVKGPSDVKPKTSIIFDQTHKIVIITFFFFLFLWLSSNLPLLGLKVKFRHVSLEIRESLWFGFKKKTTQSYVKANGILRSVCPHLMS